MNRKASDPNEISDDDAIGYARPPVASRFKLGQSGNPRGRPKGSKPVGQQLADALASRITIKDGGRTRKMSLQEVILRRLARDAAQGQLRATQLVFALVDRYRNDPETSLDTAALAEEDQAILDRYLANTISGSTRAEGQADFDDPNVDLSRSSVDDP